MAITMPYRGRFARRPLTGLGRLTVVALLGVALLLCGFTALAIGAFDPIMGAIVAVPLIVAGVVALGWRWAPLLGTLLFVLLALLLLAAVREVVLTHASGGLFTLLLLLAPLVVVGLGASVGATVQNYRGGEQQLPRWLPRTLLLLAGLSIGAAAVSTVPQAGNAVGVNQETLAALPAVTLDAFDGGVIRAKVGETVALRLENRDPVAHAFVIDALGVDAPMPAGVDSLALFRPTTPGTYTFYCRPHYDKASRQGMYGTLVVEP